MNRTRICPLLVCLAVVASLLLLPVSAQESGVYTASVTTTYYNPDTGAVDDLGTANAALGEGMCRSATHTTALVEVDSEGNTWLTIRLLLQSSCSTPTFSLRTDYDSYTSVAYTITAEDAAGDSADYRIPVSGTDAILKATMYVTPMGRDVLWYLYLDTGTMSGGGGDFVVSIDNASSSEAPTSTLKPTPSPVKTSSSAPPVTTQPAVPANTPETEESEHIPTLGEGAAELDAEGSLPPEESPHPSMTEMPTPSPVVVPSATPELTPADQTESQSVGIGVIVAVGALIVVIVVIVVGMRRGNKKK